MFEFVGDLTSCVPVEYLLDRALGIVEDRSDAAIVAGSIAIYGILKIEYYL